MINQEQMDNNWNELMSIIDEHKKKLTDKVYTELSSKLSCRRIY